MNQTYIIVLCVIGTFLIAYAVHSYEKKSIDIDSNGNPDYTRRLIRWATLYKSVQPDDIKSIQDATTMKELFSSLKNVPICRSAKLIAYLYFSIYVERDTSALNTFVDLMKEYYPDPYQWDNALKWKNANHLVWSAYDKLSKKDKQQKDKNELSILHNFKAVLSNISLKKEEKENNV